MATFQRNLSIEMMQALQADPLFQNRLLPDILQEDHEVFPAIRNNEISFYYKGRNLFKYNGKFSTHRKFGAVPEGAKTGYIFQEDLGNFTVKSSFCDAYEDIKSQCALYQEKESNGVSALYAYSGADRCRHSPVVLLDIEVSLSGGGSDEETLENTGHTVDRIDILLFDTASRQLCFCEAKHFSNGELWSQPGTKPAVCEQIASYCDTIAKNYDTILSQYQNYVRCFNQLFQVELPLPEKIFPKAGLLIFGFDKNQLNKIKALLENDGSLDGIHHYTVGTLTAKSSGTQQIETLYQNLTK